MKRYIRSAEEHMTVDEIKDNIYQRLSEEGLSDVVKQVEVQPRSSRSCVAVAQLIGKYHGKKIKESVVYKDIDASVDHLIYQISSYIDTGYTMREEDMYVMRISVDGTPLGYSKKPTGSRGFYWVGLCSNPRDSRTRRFEQMSQSKLNGIWSVYPNEYCCQNDVAIYNAGTVDSYYEHNKSGHYYVYLPRTKHTWIYELVPLNSPNIDQDAALQTLISQLPEKDYYRDRE